MRGGGDDERGGRIDYGLFCFFGGPQDRAQQAAQTADIIAIAICATICGAAGCLLRQGGMVPDLPAGGISDTFGEVFSRIDPEQFQSCFMEWTRHIWPKGKWWPLTARLAVP